MSTSPEDQLVNLLSHWLARHVGNDELRRELGEAQAQIFELREQLADAREELDAVREINRQLLADRNRLAH